MKENKELFVRLGVMLPITPEQIELIRKDNEMGMRLVIQSIIGNKATFGDTYIPAESLEEYNKRYGTDIDTKEINLF